MVRNVTRRAAAVLAVAAAFVAGLVAPAGPAGAAALTALTYQCTGQIASESRTGASGDTLRLNLPNGCYGQSTTNSGNAIVTDTTLMSQYANQWVSIGTGSAVDFTLVSPGTVVYEFGGSYTGPAELTLTIIVAPPGPTVSAAAPAVGTSAGGTSVVITGSNFTGATAVTFGTVAATSFTVDSATQITATAPAPASAPQTGTTSTVGVTVTTPQGNNTKTNAFTYHNAPDVLSFSPSRGPVAGGNAVTIYGSNFTGLSGASAVKFGSVNATRYSVTNNAGGTDVLSAVVPAGVVGDVNVTVTNAVGQATSIPLYEYLAAPTIAAVTPAFVSTAGGTAVTITGTNLTGATSVSFGMWAATSYTVDSATQITAVAPAMVSAGLSNITIITPGGTDTKTSAVTYAHPATITSVTPATGPVGGGTTVVITGTNLGGATAVSFAGVPAATFIATSTSITAVTAAGAGGVGNVDVTTPVGTETEVSGWTYVAPAPAPTPAAAGGSTVASRELHTVTFDAGSGHCDRQTLTAYDGDAVTLLPASSCHLTGYELIGWRTSSATTGEVDYALAQSVDVRRNITFTARWKATKETAAAPAPKVVVLPYVWASGRLRLVPGFTGSPAGKSLVVTIVTPTPKRVPADLVLAAKRMTIRIGGTYAGIRGGTNWSTPRVTVAYVD